tara:strand:+ start:140 stop:349 length:210 start_codon:yes stop_codon:yes gene_type:complete
MLHAGCVLIEHADQSVEGLMRALKLSEPAALGSKVFPRVMTYAKAPEYQDIIHLADFPIAHSEEFWASF